MTRIWNGLWNRCEYCHRIIGFKEFADRTAKRLLVTQEIEATVEDYKTFHVACKQAAPSV